MQRLSLLISADTFFFLKDSVWWSLFENVYSDDVKKKKVMCSRLRGCWGEKLISGTYNDNRSGDWKKNERKKNSLCNLGGDQKVQWLSVAGV